MYSNRESSAAQPCRRRGEHLEHRTGIGVHGCRPNSKTAFAQLRPALTIVIWDPKRAQDLQHLPVYCLGPDLELLFHRWINAVIDEMDTRRWEGDELIRRLAARGTRVRGPSPRGVAEGAPSAQRDVDAVVESAEKEKSRASWSSLDPKTSLVHLPAEQIEAIRRIVAGQAGADTTVRRFSSRTDDRARGGDADLVVERPRPVADPALLQPASPGA